MRIREDYKFDEFYPDGGKSRVMSPCGGGLSGIFRWTYRQVMNRLTIDDFRIIATVIHLKTEQSSIRATRFLRKYGCRMADCAALRGGDIFRTAVL